MRRSFISALLGFLALLLCLAIPTLAAPIVTDIGTAKGASGGTLAITLASNVPAGATILVLVYENTTFGGVGTAGTIADSASNTYGLNLQAGNYTSCVDVSGNVTFGKVCMFIATGVSALVSTNTITYTRYSSGSQVAMSAFYLIGVGPYTGSSFAVPCQTGSGTGTSVSATLLGNGAFGQIIGGVGWDAIGTPSAAAAFSAPPDLVNESTLTSIFGGNMFGKFLSGGAIWNPTLPGSDRYGWVMCGVQQNQTSFI